MVNQEISQLFEAIADALEFKDENRFRVNAYRRGAQEIADLAEDVTVLVAEERLTGVPGIGKGLAADIEEYLATNHMSSYDHAMEGIPAPLIELKAISGLGPKRLAVLHRTLGVHDLSSLQEALSSGKVAELSGFGPKMVANLERGIAFFARTRERMPVGLALEVSARILERLGKQVDVSRAVFAGSLRRFRETCGDLDLLIPAKAGLPVVTTFIKLEGVERVLAAGDTKASILFEGSRQVDLRVVPPQSMGAALCYFTGSKQHNVRLREIAKKKGLRLNEYGVFREDRSVAGKTEKEVYGALDLPWIPPEMREDRGEIEVARDGTLPEVLRSRDIRGDLHTHTTGSNGEGSILEMARGARERGYKYLAVTDHSAAAVYAGGMSYERWRQQAEEVNAARREVATVKILHGIEADITAEGELDLPPTAQGEPDWIVAAVHSGLRERVTERILKVMENPHVDAVAHPTGRLIGRRESYEGLDLEAVLEQAVATGTALEINSAPDRLDLPAEQARRAAEKGVRLVISSDAHSVEGLRNMELGVRLGRRAWLTRAQVLNAGPVSRLRKSGRKNGRKKQPR